MSWPFCRKHGRILWNEDSVINDLHAQLKEINEALWEIEDDIRDKERAREFDERFIELARSVYFYQ